MSTTRPKPRRKIGDKVRLSKDAKDACLTDLWSNRAEGDITTKEYDRAYAWLMSGKPVEICGIEEGCYVIGAKGKAFDGTGLMEPSDLRSA